MITKVSDALSEKARLSPHETAWGRTLSETDKAKIIHAADLIFGGEDGWEWDDTMFDTAVVDPGGTTTAQDVLDMAFAPLP